jgi:hypothetical protein
LKEKGKKRDKETSKNIFLVFPFRHLQGSHFQYQNLFFFIVMVMKKQILDAPIKIKRLNLHFSCQKQVCIMNKSVDGVFVGP